MTVIGFSIRGRSQIMDGTTTASQAAAVAAIAGTVRRISTPTSSRLLGSSCHPARGSYSRAALSTPNADVRNSRNDQMLSRDTERQELGISEAVDWNAKTIAEFRANEGKVGGNFEGAPMVLVPPRGAIAGAKTSIR